MGMLALVAACGEEETGPVYDYPVPGVAKQRIQVGNTNHSFEVVLVKAGTFNMGSSATDPVASVTEQPAHPVAISEDFFIGTVEVTQRLYEAVLNNNPSRDARGGDYPVESVDYASALEFCERLSDLTGRTFTLPTEAQWEYAARGGHKAPSPASAYPGADILGDVAWCAATSEGSIHPVGQKVSNQLGIFDMAGNVWEWCLDWYGAGYYSDPGLSLADPQGPREGTERVIRGGGWNASPVSCRVTDRDYAAPTTQRDYIGFRVVMKP